MCSGPEGYEYRAAMKWKLPGNVFETNIGWVLTDYPTVAVCFVKVLNILFFLKESPLTTVKMEFTATRLDSTVYFIKLRPAL